jgi:hypothetical protein
MRTHGAMRRMLIANASRVAWLSCTLVRRERRRNWIEPRPGAVGDEHTSTGHVEIVISTIQCAFRALGKPEHTLETPAENPLWRSRHGTNGAD